jgi:DNA-binding protein HU-beta
MNKAQLTAAIAADTNRSKADVTEFLDSLTKTIQAEVAKGGEVILIGFGTFKRTHREARDGRNPSTGQTIRIEAKHVPAFKPGATFKALVTA